MNPPPEPTAQKLTKDISRVIWGMAIVWTLIVAALFAINARQHRQAIRHTAVSQARVHFQKDLTFAAGPPPMAGPMFPPPNRPLPIPI